MAHVTKFAKGSVGSLTRHYERAKGKDGEYIKFGNQDIDTSKTHLNYNLASDHNQLNFIKERCSQVKCMNREDVKVMCSWVVTAPKDLPTADNDKFFQETYNFLKNRYGGEKNVISSYVHIDENTPHMHFAFVPVTIDKKSGIEKVSAKEVLTKKDLKTFHVDLEGHLKKIFGRDMGILNEVTKEGNMSIEELKRKSATERLNEAKQEADRIISEANETVRDNLSKTYEYVRQASLEVQELKESMMPLEKDKEALESDIEALKRLKGTATAHVKEKKNLFTGEIEVTIPKKRYDALVSSEARAGHADIKLKNAEAMGEDIEKLMGKNKALEGEVKKLTFKLGKIERVFQYSPELKKNFDEAEKNIDVEESKTHMKAQAKFNDKKINLEM